VGVEIVTQEDLESGRFDVNREMHRQAAAYQAHVTKQLLQQLAVPAELIGEPSGQNYAAAIIDSRPEKG
jgi:hypothetical protein